jgi:uncharacterized membrane protein YbaN (DUF454 family)
MTKEPATLPVQSKVSKRKSVRVLLFIAGSISLFLGVIGIFLPILPTTPFLLLTAACYMRSSERMHNWLLNNRWFGEYIRNYQAGRGIPLKTKIIAIAAMWITMSISIILVARDIVIMQVALIIIASAVTIHIIRLPTFKKP